MRILLMLGCTVLLLAGCGSDSEEPKPDEATPAKQAGVPAGKTAGEENLWAPYSAAEASKRSATPPFDHSFRAPPPAARPDPDAVLERYQKDCADKADSPDCRSLRRDVEHVFLDDLIGLRNAGQPIDDDLLRAAATAETPQLACIGLRDRLRADKRTGADWALLAAALDSPWRAPRNAALIYARLLPPDSTEAVPTAMKMLEREGRYDYRGPTDICIDGWRDPLPNPGLAGHYPNARYRPFASDATRRWFTTADAPEKVFAYFAQAGLGPALTAEALKAAAQAKYLQAMTDMSQAPDAVDAQKLTERMMKLAMEQGIDWSSGFRDMPGTGEIRYVMVTPKQAVAVFRDDLLDATSIVAPRPPEEPNAAFDMELAKRDALARSVFGF
jgi:hypothetical protein